MSETTTSALLKQLHWRYAVKQFDPTQSIPSDIWATLEETLVLTPSSYGLQPWKFIVITNKELREQLKPASWGQAQITDSSHLVVFAIKKNLSVENVDQFIARIAEVRGITPESIDFYRKLILADVIYGPRSLNVNEWATRQVYIALGNFLTSAALLGVDTCPLEGIDPAKYDKLLGLPEKGYATVVAAAAGYRSDEDKYAQLPKVRYPKSDVIEVLA